MTEPMNAEAVAQMVADMQAGTPGPWDAEEKPGQLSEHGSQSSIGVWAQARWDRAYECDPDDTASADDAAWLCGIWGKLTPEDYANAARIARVPAMEQTILALAAENATLRAELDEGLRLLDNARQIERNVQSVREHEHKRAEAALAEIATLRASEAAAVDALKQIKALGDLSMSWAVISYRALSIANAATTDKEPKT